LIKERADKACNIAKKTGIRGMDTIVVQIAEENNSTLLSLDEEMLERIEGKINVEIGDIERI